MVTVKLSWFKYYSPNRMDRDKFFVVANYYILVIVPVTVKITSHDYTNVCSACWSK